MPPYLGDYGFGQTVHLWFNSSALDASPITLADTPAVTVYKNGGGTQDSSGVSLDVDFDSVTGLHYVAIDMSADATFFSRASDFVAVLEAGEVDGVSVIGKAVAQWSVENRSMHTAMADSIAPLGSMPTVVQAILMVARFLTTRRRTVGSSMEVYKEDGTTPSITFALDDPLTPTDCNRDS